MNYYLVVAGLLTIVIGLIHSIFGEILIFRNLRDNGFIPTQGGSILKERKIRIIWASWHLVTIFGFGIGVIALILSVPLIQDEHELYILITLICSMLLGSLLVLVATKSKHPGWIGLLMVAILLWLSY